MDKSKMKRAVRLAFVPLVSICLAAPVYAAGETAKDKGTAASAKSGKQVSNYRGFKASNLIGKSVKNPQGKDIGEIKDLVVHMSTCDVRYAILSAGGFMGLGDKLYAIPVKSFKLAANRDDMVLEMDKARIEQQKSFPRDKWPALKDKQFWGEVDRLSGLPAVQPADAYYAFRASELIGKDVVNVEGKDVGDLKDFVINMNTQKVHYAVLEFDPGIFKSEKLFAVPLRAFMFKRDQGDRTDLKTENLVLNVGKSQLEKMRGFEKNKWPDINDSVYVVDIDRYFISIYPPKDAPAGGTGATR